MAQYDRFPLQGGLDLSTPYISRDPGSLLQSQNFEPDTDGGYRVMGGYERISGRPAPSGAKLYEVTLATPLPDPLARFGARWKSDDEISHFFINQFIDADRKVLWVDVIDVPPTVGRNIKADFSSSQMSLVTAVTEVLVDVNTIVGNTFDDAGYLTVAKTNVPEVPLLVPGYRLRAEAANSTEVAQLIVRDKRDPVSQALQLYVEIESGDITKAVRLVPVPSLGYALSVLSAGELEEYLQDPNTPQGALFASQECRRNGITTVGGVGPVRGVWDFRDKVYAIRDSSVSAAQMWTTSSVGWVQVPLGFTMGWDNRPSTTNDLDLIKGDTILGATSGATGTVGLVGYIDQEHFSGFISMVSFTGTFVAGENLTVNGKVIGKVTAPPTANTLPAGGLYRFFNHNFAAGLDQYSMYAANGVGPAFAFDGTNFAFIHTGVPAAQDKPFEVKVHYDHLFLAFPNGSLQHSVVGNPLDWSGGTGALELGIGAEITDLIITPKSLIICTEKDIQVLLGTGVDSWTKDVVTTHTGVRKFTGQYQSMAFVAARPGLIAIDRVDAFGNFADAVISDKIRDLITSRYGLWGPGMADKTKSQYRLYGSDGLNLVFSVYQGELKGIMPFRYDIPVRNIANPNGRILFTSDSGYVYQSDVGSSNDGAERAIYIRTSYATQGDPDTRKRFKRCAVSLSGSLFRELGVSFAFDKGRSDTPNSFISDMVTGAGGRWALNEWDRIYWDSPDVEEIRKDMDGVGSDVSLIVYLSSRAATPFILEDVSFEYEPRRKVR